jgi:two-component sensor histidine kinase
MPVSYPVPVNEKQRLAALQSYKILDTLPEPSFDRITATAARLFAAPIAVVSLVDRDRQWFKAKLGIDAQETSRDSSFSTHALLESKPMVVCDATRDVRFQSNPMVTGERCIRFYVGAPLRNAQGLALGTLSVLDTVPREAPSENLLASLSDLAFLAVEQMEFHSAIAACARADEALKATAMELRRLLAEKDLLLREVHHRVGNNFQLISSLLNLEAETVNDRVALQVLKGSQRRVRSMAMVHSDLYGSKEMGRIDFGQYTQTVVHELSDQFHGSFRSDICCLNVSPVLLTVAQAIPCGLVLNELVTNALKFAYPGSSAGKISVELREPSASNVQLVVSDEGVGLPCGFDWKNTKTLGLRIVDVLVDQLGGTLTVHSGPGAVFILDFAKDVQQHPLDHLEWKPET